METTTTNLWEVLLREFALKSNQPEYIIECLAVYPIVKMSAEGYSNYRIAKRLEVPVGYVEDTLVDFLNTTGWESDLDFSPLAIYNRCGRDYCEYVRQAIQVSATERSETILVLSYNMCKLYHQIKQELDRYERSKS